MCGFVYLPFAHSHHWMIHELQFYPLSLFVLRFPLNERLLGTRETGTRRSSDFLQPRSSCIHGASLRSKSSLKERNKAKTSPVERRSHGASTQLHMCGISSKVSPGEIKSPPMRYSRLIFDVSCDSHVRLGSRGGPKTQEEPVLVYCTAFGLSCHVCIHGSEQPEAANVPLAAGLYPSHQWPHWQHQIERLCNGGIF